MNSARSFRNDSLIDVDSYRCSTNYTNLDMLTLETALVRDPYARWCERPEGASPPAYSIRYHILPLVLLLPTITDEQVFRSCAPDPWIVFSPSHVILYNSSSYGSVSFWHGICISERQNTEFRKGKEEKAMKRIIMWTKLSNRGQSATEYVLVLAVVVLALVAAASRLIMPFQEGVSSLGDYVRSVLGSTPTMTQAE